MTPTLETRQQATRGDTTGPPSRARIDLAWAALATLALACAVASRASAQLSLTPDDDLAGAIGRAPEGTEILLGPGEYVLTPHPFTESTCGNCEESTTPVDATLGLMISGRGLRVRGAGAGSTIIRTRAGYGILFDGCTDCALSGVTVTGGVRDPDANATDAGIVVKHSSVTLFECRIEENIGDQEIVGPIVVGIIGIAGREGSDIHIERCVIRRNSWDGIALYRDSRAAIFDNVIDGVDQARGREVGGGRGVGIGVTWNAEAVIVGNLVKRYWKGIGLFVDAKGLVRENVVEQMLTWGISLWDAGKGAPRGIIERNAVYDTGACGVSIVRADSTTTPGRLVDNAFVRTGQDERYDSGEPYCHQRAIAEHDVPDDFEIRGNLLFENREPGGTPGSQDTPPDSFQIGVARLTDELRKWKALWGSAFLVRFGG